MATGEWKVRRSVMRVAVMLAVHRRAVSQLDPCAGSSRYSSQQQQQNPVENTVDYSLN